MKALRWLLLSGLLACLPALPVLAAAESPAATTESSAFVKLRDQAEAEWKAGDYAAARTSFARADALQQAQKADRLQRAEFLALRGVFENDAREYAAAEDLF